MRSVDPVSLRTSAAAKLPPAQSLADVDWTCDTGSEEVKEVANLLSNIFIGADPTVKRTAQYILDSELVESFLASTTAAKPATDASRVAFTEVSLKRRRLAPPPRVADTTTDGAGLHSTPHPPCGSATTGRRADGPDARPSAAALCGPCLRQLSSASSQCPGQLWC